MADEKPIESRMSRWSRRKLDQAKEDVDAKANAEQAAIAAAGPSEEEIAAQEAEQAQMQANREAAEAVDLETADKDTDYTVFMKSGVPAALKRKAFSVLWRSDPVLANLDELLDYGENFADPKLNMEVFKSAWQIGKGYLDKDDEEIAEADSAADDDEDESNETLAESEPDAETEESSVDERDEVEVAKSDQDVEEIEIGDTKDEFELVEDIQPKVSLRKRLMLET